MLRKDCTTRTTIPALGRERCLARRSPSCFLLAITITITMTMPVSLAAGESVRVWPSAVVVDEAVLLGDVAELRGFMADAEQNFIALRITAAPLPGGSRVIHIAMIREALALNGANMATLTLRGATQCEVTRPADPVKVAARPAITAEPQKPETQNRVGPKATTPGGKPVQSLQGAVQDFFDKQLSRYAGHAEILFDRTSRQVLELSGPSYEFIVRRRNGPILGLIQIEVSVLAEGQIVQTVPLVVQVSMTRNAVMARRAINRGATIRASDVGIQSITFNRLEKLGFDDMARVVGQRAKEFIPPGATFQANVLESIPLVNRGQLVTLISVAGAIQVVTTAKAMQNGVLGDSITVRSTENRRVKFEATVVGPGTVRIGYVPGDRGTLLMAAGGVR